MSDSKVLSDEDCVFIADIIRRRGRWHGSSPHYNGYLPEMRSPEESKRNLQRAHRLVRQGWLRRERHSEQVRGEPRFYWWAFRPTDEACQSVREWHKRRGQ
jgi:hypothetical protein